LNLHAINKYFELLSKHFSYLLIICSRLLEKVVLIMGLLCNSCGAIVDGTIANSTVIFDTIEQGTLTFTANLCANTPETSSLEIIFSDTGGTPANRSFTFTANNFNTIRCTLLPNGTCQVGVSGTGFVSGENEPRVFNVLLGDGNNVAPDTASFLIIGFAIQESVSPSNIELTSGFVEALNCGF
jgi:hypothetical protein